MDFSFAQRLRDGELLIGTMVSLPSPEVTEILAITGFDWLFIDAEHGAFNPQQAQSMLQAAGTCPCVIRVPAGEDIWIKKALDIGAAGIIVPQVHTAEQGGQIIELCKYAPAGKRGVGIGRAHQYGMAFEQYLSSANDKTAVILQAESRASLENIEAIVRLKGLDAVLIGPYDLSASLGKTGQIDDPEVQDAITTIANACLSAGIRVGYFGVSIEAVKPGIARGFTLITAGVDALFISSSARSMLSGLRGE